VNNAYPNVNPRGAARRIIASALREVPQLGLW
jgi:hypothetical protein